MTMPELPSTRRDFLGSTGALALAAGAGVMAGEAALASPAAMGAAVAGGLRGDKQIIPGSPSPAYSRAVRLDHLVFVAGCVGTYLKDGKSGLDADFRKQAVQTLINLKLSIEAAGSRVENVLKCTCFLKEYSDFKEFNEIYMGVFTKNPPARSTVVVKDFVVPGALLEVDCVCYVE